MSVVRIQAIVMNMLIATTHKALISAVVNRDTLAMDVIADVRLT